MLAPEKNKKGASSVLWLLICLLFFGIGVGVGYFFHEWEFSGRNSYPATCLRVLDGDTFEIVWANGTNKVRLAGIDCPEVHDNNKLQDQARRLHTTPGALLQIGQTIKNQADVQLPGRQITLVFPRKTIERDAFGRLLAYVEVNGMDFGGMLVRNGLAYPRSEENPRRLKYESLNAQAQQQKKGVYAFQK